MSQRHVVQEGDTLWSISTQYLNDPFYWPKVWGVNRSLGNPDLIYPGMTIELPSPEMLETMRPVPAPVAPQPVAPVEVEAPAPQPPVEEVRAPEPPPAPVAMPEPKVEEAKEPLIMVRRPMPGTPDLVGLASAGYIYAGDFQQQGRVMGGRDNRTLMGNGDVVYLDPRRMEALEVGDHLLVYRNIRRIFHPRTDTYLGDLIVALGVVEVDEINPRVATGRVVKTYNYIKVGDPVAPYDVVPFPALGDMPAEEDQGVEGYVVDVREDKVVIGQHDVVYLDLGALDGISRGSRFTVFREGDRISTSWGRKTPLPARQIAELEVITVGDETATARVYQSIEPVRKGDRIVSFGPAQP